MKHSTFFEKFTQCQDYPVQADSLVIRSIDMHTGGEPLRVIINGYPDIKATSLLDYRRQLKQNYDHLRTALMFEPRGHADMYGCVLLPPFNPKADCSVIFMHNEGYSTMCGHAIIAIMTLAIEMGWVELKDGNASLTIEAPCGLIKASGQMTATDDLKSEKISASFECVPSFVTGLDQSVFVPSLNRNVQYDLAYGGAFYAYVNCTEIGISISNKNLSKLIELGCEIKQLVSLHSNLIQHPFETDLSFLYGAIFIDEAKNPSVDSQNVCVFADGEVDRSPTGSGVSGRMAIHYARGEIVKDQRMLIESILGSTFSVEVIDTLEFGGYQAVIPRVSGDAFVCGLNQFIVNPQDPLKHGFLIG